MMEIGLSREDARARGLKYYQPDKPCIHAHDAPRFTSNRACVTCSKEQSKTWYGDPQNKDKISTKFKKYRAKNLDYEKTRQAEWRLANKDLFVEITKAWRSANAERFREKNKEWRHRNTARVSYYNSLRRARERNGEGYTSADVEDIGRLQGKKCAVCRVRLGAKYHIDHIIALKNGGRNDRRNLQLLCQPCNQTKSARCPIEFMQSRGRLL